EEPAQVRHAGLEGEEASHPCPPVGCAQRRRAVADRGREHGAGGGEAGPAEEFASIHPRSRWRLPSGRATRRQASRRARAAERAQGGAASAEPLLRWASSMRALRLLPLLPLLICLAGLPARASQEESEDASAAEELVSTDVEAEELLFAASIIELQETRLALLDRIADGSAERMDVAYDEAVRALRQGGARLREALAARADPAEIDALAAEVESLNALRIEILAGTS